MERGAGPGEVQVELGVMQPQAKGLLEPSEEARYCYTFTSHLQRPEL